MTRKRQLLSAAALGVSAAAGYGLFECWNAYRDADDMIRARGMHGEYTRQVTIRPAYGDGGDQPLFKGSVQGTDRRRSEYAAFNEFPPNLVNAVVAIEDHRFYQHHGVDFVRTAKAAFAGLVSRSKPRGTSTLTQQLARTLYLDREPSFRRKVREAAAAWILESNFSKNEILERYLNAVPLGHQLSYDIHGVRLAAKAHFGKDLNELTLAQCAMLAGMIQAPARLNPEENPKAAKERRRLVLAAMLREGKIDDVQRSAANSEPVEPSVLAAAAGSGEYFLDAVHHELRGMDAGGEVNLDVRSTIDVRLERIAEQAVTRWGKVLDGRFAKSKKRPEIAVVALDPRTGAIRAMVGGRSFAQSQFNRAYANRPPGSLFKAFVYAAALDQSILYGDARWAPDTMIEDSPLTVDWGGKRYTPGNYKGYYAGKVSMENALASSLNTAAVRVAGEVGYSTVSSVAHRAGLEHTQATPSAALGSYDASPVALAGAFAVFANGGYAVRPHTIESVSPSTFSRVSDSGLGARVIDPRAAYLTLKMLEGVVRQGTAAQARALGVTQVAAGKTGTTHDSWFAGFTSELVTVVWIGFDDHTDLGIEGSKGALLVWADVMKQAGKLKPYASATEFAKPAGVDEYLELVASRRAEEAELKRQEAEEQDRLAAETADLVAHASPGALEQRSVEVRPIKVVSFQVPQ